ncbi:L-aspartate oxidase [Arthrobacter monumenti]
MSAQSQVRHVVVAGSGIAGLYAALLAAGQGDTRVTLISKSALPESNTYFAQGGISAVLPQQQAASGDTVQAHIADTLAAGAGLNKYDAVELLCASAQEEVGQLSRFGVGFDGSTFGTEHFYALGLEAAHSAPRILHSGGDATGASMANALIAAVRQRTDDGAITVLEHTFLTDILRSGERAAGVAVLRNGATEAIPADAVVLATGGAGQLFEHTTNPKVATADGLAAAWRAGAALSDLEFFQFHPTALDVPGSFMISEAVRGEGAVLRDASGHRFMSAVHPDAELAPRDVVSRGIAEHLRTLAAAGKESRVFLDATGVAARRGPDFLARRFPTIDRRTRELGFDWNTGWLPVRPAAHYWMGGISTDLWGRTSVPNLYAAGEAACTGVHGANRLASNSLLEGLVFARRAVQYISGQAADPGRWPDFGAKSLHLGEDLSGAASSMAGTLSSREDGSQSEDFTRAELQRLMAANAALVRDGGALAVAAKQLEQWRRQPVTVADHEDANLLLAARLLVTASRRREESVGAHFRSDHPGHDWPHTRHLTYVNADH